MGRYPVPNHNRELESVGSGPVTTTRLSPEELARYRNLPAPNDKKKPRIQFTSDAIKYEKPAVHTYEEAVTMDMTTTKHGLTKEIYLEERKTKKNAQIERDWKLPANDLYRWLKAWGITGKSPAIEQEQPVTEVEPVVEDLIPVSKGYEPDDFDNYEKIIDPAAEYVYTPQPAPIIHTEPVEIIPQRKSKRSMRIEATGNNSVIENELIALLTYVQVMEGKSFSLELSLVETT